MPDTTILKSLLGSRGWFDRDDPTLYFPTRRQARAHRRARTGGRVIRLRPTTVVASGPTRPQFDGLQNKLFSRWEDGGTITEAEATEVLTTVYTKVGYNAAASYGHIRQYADHQEALEVVGYASSSVSNEYSRLRASGMYSHDLALTIARKADSHA